MLPAIVFLNSCENCDSLAINLTRHVQKLENSDKDYQEKKRKEEKIIADLVKINKKEKKLNKKNPETEKDDSDDAASSNLFFDKNKYSFLDMK